MANEWGCGASHDYNSRITFYVTYVNNAITNGMALFEWDDGGEFQTYVRNGRYWRADVKDCMVSDPFTSVGLKAACWDQMSGVQRQTTSDVGGGQNVGFVDGGDWMTYLINVPKTGTYKVEYRVASINSNGQIRIEKAGGGKTYGTIDVPDTGDWQTWQTISHNVQLTAGVQNIGIAAQKGGWNLNWIKMSLVQ